MERTKKFTLKGNSYTIEFPTAGQFIDIETKKSELSHGQWGKMVLSPTISTFRSVQMMECISILSVICPKLMEDLKVPDLTKIDLIDLTEILKVYVKEIYPWYNDWFKEFNKAFTDNLEEDNTEDSK